jgi:hypothetical protein
MQTPFLNLESAREYAATIEDRVQRVWVQYCLNSAVAILAKEWVDDPSSRAESPLDLLRHVKLSHAHVKDRDLVDLILSGKYERFADIPDIF